MKYNPHEYQVFATDYILEHHISAVFLECGLGKSVITLTAIFDLVLGGKVLLGDDPVQAAKDIEAHILEKRKKMGL